MSTLVTIFVIAAVIIYEAYNRLRQPPEVKSVLMMAIAFVGLSANVLVTWWLRRAQRTNINIRSAFWHALGMLWHLSELLLEVRLSCSLGSSGSTPWSSVLISLIILWAAWSIFREGFRVILEATPRDVDIMAMINSLKQIPGVRDVHDIHVWSISPELRAMNGHVLIEDVSTSECHCNTGQRIEKVVREQFHITHTTLQMECTEVQSGDLFCKSDRQDKSGEDKHAESKQ